ncbi:MAG: hypothetical protein M5R41_02800 [Bacteroidia bacterium]|nr:hypothetical protein [Bacteroidia bacterium]
MKQRHTIPSRANSIRVYALLLLLFPVAITAQDVGDMQTFGSMQAIFFNQNSQLERSVVGIPATASLGESRNSFALQQLDFFFTKQFDDAFSAFVDIEFQLNYSSEKRWGSLSIQEAWMNYSLRDEVNLKLGLLFPAFNHFNEIKNRLALQPYIFRPLVYERLLSTRFMTEDYIPEHAYVQVYGSIPWGPVFADYAVYAGNSESSYITRYDALHDIETEKNPQFEFLSGVDPNSFALKLFGGRIGVRSRDEQIKFGASLTHDANNMLRRYASHESSISLETLSLLPDDAKRWRLGGDLSVHVSRLTLETELINVAYDLDEAGERDLKMEQWFLYWVLGYDLTDAIYPYVSMQWGDYRFGVDADYSLPLPGLSWRLRRAVTVKGQVVLYDEREHGVAAENMEFHQDLRIIFILFGVSVLL